MKQKLGMKWFDYFCGIRPILAIIATLIFMIIGCVQEEDAAGFFVFYAMLRIVLYISLFCSYYTHKEMGIYPSSMYPLVQIIGWVELSFVVVMYNMDYFAKRGYLFCKREYLDRVAEIKGQCVWNKDHGAGEIIGYENGSIRVEFEKIRIRYMYPEAFKQKMLRWGNDVDAAEVMARKGRKNASIAPQNALPSQVESTTETKATSAQTVDLEVFLATLASTSNKFSPPVSSVTADATSLKKEFSEELKKRFSKEYFKKAQMFLNDGFATLINEIEKPFEYLEFFIKKAKDEETKIWLQLIFLEHLIDLERNSGRLEGYDMMFFLEIGNQKIKCIFDRVCNYIGNRVSFRCEDEDENQDDDEPIIYICGEAREMYEFLDDALGDESFFGYGEAGCLMQDKWYEVFNKNIKEN